MNVSLKINFNGFLSYDISINSHEKQFMIKNLRLMCYDLYFTTRFVKKQYTKIACNNFNVLHVKQIMLVV